LLLLGEFRRGRDVLDDSLSEPWAHTDRVLHCVATIAIGKAAQARERLPELASSLEAVPDAARRAAVGREALWWVELVCDATKFIAAEIDELTATVRRSTFERPVETVPSGAPEEEP
jgi:hypothetical protein